MRKAGIRGAWVFQDVDHPLEATGKCGPSEAVTEESEEPKFVDILVDTDSVRNYLNMHLVATRINEIVLRVSNGSVCEHFPRLAGVQWVIPVSQ